MSDLKTTITRDGQRYVDEPIVVHPRQRSGVERSVEYAVADLEVIGTQAPASPVEMPRKVTRAALLRAPMPITVGHERVLLRWMTSDCKGGLKPRESR